MNFAGAGLQRLMGISDLVSRGAGKIKGLWNSSNPLVKYGMTAGAGALAGGVAGTMNGDGFLAGAVGGAGVGLAARRFGLRGKLGRSITGAAIGGYMGIDNGIGGTLVGSALGAGVGLASNLGFVGRGLSRASGYGVQGLQRLGAKFPNRLGGLRNITNMGAGKNLYNTALVGGMASAGLIGSSFFNSNRGYR